MGEFTRALHCRELQSFLYKQFQDGCLCDIDILSSEGNTFRAHRLVVGASSAKLHKMFSKDENLHSVIVDLPTAVLQSLLEFCYTGQLVLTDQIYPLAAQAASFLQMHGALELLEMNTEGNSFIKFTLRLDPSPTEPCSLDLQASAGCCGNNTKPDENPCREKGSDITASTASVGVGNTESPGPPTKHDPTTSKSNLQEKVFIDEHEKSDEIESSTTPHIRQSARIKLRKQRESILAESHQKERKIQQRRHSNKQNKTELLDNEQKRRRTAKDTRKNYMTTKECRAKGDSCNIKSLKKKKFGRKYHKTGPIPVIGKKSSRGRKKIFVTADAEHVDLNIVASKVVEKIRDTNLVRVPKQNTCICVMCGVKFSCHFLCHQHMLKTHRHKLIQAENARDLLKKSFNRKLTFQGLVKVKGKNGYECAQCKRTFRYYSRYRLHHIRLHSVQKKVYHKVLKQFFSNYLKSFEQSQVGICGRLVRGDVDEICQTFEEVIKSDGTKVPAPELHEPLSSGALTDLSSDGKDVLTKKTASFASDYSTNTSSSKESLDASSAFECSLCSQKLSSQYTLFKHLRSLHLLSATEARRCQFNVSNKMKCEVGSCTFVSSHLVDMQTHVNGLHPHIQYSCTTCKAQFQVKLLLQRHLALCSGSGVQSDSSQQRTSLRGQASREQKQKQSRPGQKQKQTSSGQNQTSPGQKLTMKDSLKKKTGWEEEPSLKKKKHMCRLCEKAFHKLQGLRRHEYWKHGVHHPSVKIYECSHPGCSYQTSASSSMKAHASKHQEEKPFTCEYCGLKLKTAISHKKHINKMHLGIRPFLCQICGNAFGEEHELKTHITRHNGDRDFQCEYCPYATSWKTSLYTHLFNIHKVRAEDDKRRVFKCPHCPYVSIIHHRFKVHLNRHAGKLEFECKMCNSKFVSSAALRSHKQWRHSDKYVSCSQCNYQTKTNQRLNEHIRVQHQLKGCFPYKCPYCEFKCATGGNTRKHIKQVHKNFEVRYIKDSEMLSAARAARASGHYTSLAEMASDKQIQRDNKADTSVCNELSVGNVLEIMTS